MMQNKSEAGHRSDDLPDSIPSGAGKRIYGITGGIGSGKSYVARILADRLDLLYIDTDSLAKAQMRRGGISYDGVVAAFGADRILDGAGEIDAKELSRIVFADKEARALLNSLTHPNVIREVKDTIDRVRADRAESPAGVIVESALMIEAGFTDIFDEIIFVRAPLEDRVGRLKRERGYDDSKISSILASQQSEDAFARAATIIIDNPDGATEESITNCFAIMTGKGM